MPEEALYFLNKTNATYLLTEPNTNERATVTCTQIQSMTKQQIHIIPIQTGLLGLNKIPEMEIGEDLQLDPTLPCFVIFTSGTTGKPKGVVLPRQRFYFQGQLDSNDLYLAYRPVHWIGGAMPLFTTVLQGGRFYSMKRPKGALAAELWKIFKKCCINVVSLSPALSKELQEYYIMHIRNLPLEEHERYLAGISKLRMVINSGSALNLSTAQFWRELVDLPIRNAYAATELGGAAIMTPQNTHYVDVDPHSSSCKMCTLAYDVAGMYW